MKRSTRKTTPSALDEYDWVELFTQFRENPNKPRVGRVMRILELLISLRAKETSRLHVLTELNARLREYQWHSPISPLKQGAVEVLRSPIGVTGSEAWEYTSVRSLLNLFQRGELKRVRLCPMKGKRPDCAGWFYSAKGKFCSGNCRQYRYNKANEEGIKARRAANRKHHKAYRVNLKRKEATAKIKVGFMGAVSAPRGQGRKREKDAPKGVPIEPREAPCTSCLYF